jgi:hypothetical protein
MIFISELAYSLHLGSNKYRKDNEDVYSDVVDDMYHNHIISEKTFDRITDWDNEKDKEKDDFEL